MEVIYFQFASIVVAHIFADILSHIRLISLISNIAFDISYPISIKVQI